MLQSLNLANVLPIALEPATTHPIDVDHEDLS